MRRVILLLLVLFASMLPVSMLASHPMPDSFVTVRMAEDRWRVTMELPSDRLGMALVNVRAIPDPGPNFTEYPPFHESVVANYVSSHLRVTGADGRVWRTDIISARPVAGDIPIWQVEADLTPPEAGPGTEGTLHYDVIIKEVIPDVAIVSLTQDWQGGLVGGDPRLLGALSLDNRSLPLSSGEGGEWASLFAMFKLGMHHILEGLDHLAFLLCLMLPVALLADDRRWRPIQKVRPIVARALWRVSAFTVGHTLALLAVAVGWFPPAGQFVEILIGLSVALAAIHAIRPIYPGRESWIAALFGLVHGTAFATVIQEMALPSSTVIAATLSFNLGIEAVQIALVAVALPLLIWLRDKPSEPGARVTLAVIALIAAAYWVGERIVG